jgi:hypothetical protein
MNTRDDQHGQHVNYKLVRVGKTEKDHQSGAWSRRLENQRIRAVWRHEGGKFPAYACNGKRNRQVSAPIAK